MKKFITYLLSLFNLSLIKKEKLIKIDLERKKFKHEYEKLEFIFLNNRIKNPIKLFKYIPDSESQIFQDLFVLNELKFKRNGYFIEIGAANGKNLSNTYMFEKYFAWQGLVVEPARIWKEQLRANRQCKISYDCVASESNLTVEFYETEKPEFSRIKLDKNYIDGHEYLRKKNKKVYKVNTISIDDLFVKYDIPVDIDYLSVDTEGSEFDILSMLNFEKYNISIITVEHNFTVNREKIFELLTKNNFNRVQIEYSQFDDWYINKNLYNNDKKQ